MLSMSEMGGGFAQGGLELLKVAIEKAGYTGRIQIGMDSATSEFYKDRKRSDPSKWMACTQLVELYHNFYPIVSIEDGFDQDDLDNKEQIVGDNLLVTMHFC